MSNSTGLSPELQILVDADSGARSTTAQCDACSPIISARESSSDAFHQGVAYQKAPRLLQYPISSSNYHAVLGPDSQAPALLSNRTLDLLDDFETPATVKDFARRWERIFDWDSLQPTLERLLSLGFLIPKDCMAHQYVEVPHTLAAWLHVTDRCNLRCVYCYLPHSKEDMPAHVGATAIEATFRSARSHGYQSVKLKYAGGEPLLVIATVVQMHKHARELAWNHGFNLDGVVLSNGILLTAQVIETLKEMGLNLTVSLDGLGMAQDSQRPYADGHGSAVDVLQGVELAIAMGLKPRISITVSPRNIGGLPDLLRWILEHDLHFGLNFYRESDLSATTRDLRLDEELIIKGLLKAYRVIEGHMPRHRLWSSLADRLDLSTPHLRACSVGHSYLVFSPSGRLSKCQMDMEHTIGDINDADPLIAVRQSQSGIVNSPVDQVSECQTCRWRYWCAGGCPLMAYRATGRYDSKSPNCNIYKAIFPEILRLEGLRLLEHAKSQHRA
jgi:uncharacterized protein